MEQEQLRKVIEAVILAVGEPITVNRLLELFDEDERPEAKELREVLNSMQEDYAERGIELKELASGYCFQSRQDYSKWIARLWEERAPRYSRALLETLAIIAYRQPVTRAEIEDIRGVAVSSSIMKTLLERDWIKILGHRDVPGKPGIYGSTKDFLDYFGLKSLDQLPTLEEIKDLEQLVQKMDNQMEFEGIAAAEQTEIVAETETGEPGDVTEEIIAQSSEEVLDEDDDDDIDLDAVFEQVKEISASSLDYQAEVQAQIQELENPTEAENAEAVVTTED